MISLKLIIRNFFKVRSYAILNITGLGLCFASVFTIITWVKNEFDYDRQLPFPDRTYRLTFETNRSGNRLHFARCWEPWISRMPSSFPQIEELVRLSPYRHTALKIGENKFYSDRIFATDSNFFKVFGTKISAGDPEQALKEPYSAIISSSLAERFFGETDPLGQTILYSGEYDTKMTLLTVKGIMEDSPERTHLHIDILTSFADPLQPPDWAYVYLLLNKGADKQELLSLMPEFIKKAEGDSESVSFKTFLQKVTDIHLHSNKDREVEPNGNITSIYLFVLVAVVLILISLTNYFNLNKSRIIALRKQLLIQKINGSGNRPIIMQSFAESSASVLISVLFAFLLINLLAKPINNIASYTVFESNIKYISYIWFYIIAVIAISLITGSLPLMLNILRKKIIINDLKEEISESINRRSSYGFLMAGQFFLAIVLLIVAITINMQKKYILGTSLGNMDPDIIAFRKLNWEIRGKYTSIKDRAIRDPLIKDVTASIEEPSGETADAMQVESPELDDAHKDNPLYTLVVEDNFLDFFDIPLLTGRNFSPFNSERKGEDYILNESALKKLGWTAEEAIGRPFRVKFDVPDIIYGGTVVGVAEDFHFTTVKQEIKPYVLFQKPIFYLCIIVKIDGNRKDDAIQHLRTIWEEELPDYPFQYEFLSDLYRSSYSKELTQASMVSIFSILALLIICIGLYSVASLFVAQRTKEIGIRKVNGATVVNILLMLNTIFVKWFAIAFVVACPVAWYAMDKWLQNFVYKVGFKWWFLPAAGLIILLVVIMTVTVKSWNTATKNPSGSLRYE